MAPDPFQWISDLFHKPTPALQRMRLAPPSVSKPPLMLQFFTWDTRHDHLSWWSHFEQEIPNIAAMGFTQVWLPPPNKAAAQTGRGYDAYDLWDLGEFDQKGGVATRWGTKEELLRACKTARQHGIDILVDAVLNHKLGADSKEAFNAVPVDPQNRLKSIGAARTIEGWTVFDFPGRRSKYSSLQWNQAHFTGLDWDHSTRTNGVFRITGKGHHGWSKNVDSELGNYDYLLGVDIDHRHPEVQEDLIKWGKWVLEEMGGSGFRLDAIKHIDHKFMLHFIKSVRQRRGDPQMFVVSELWSGDINAVLPYVRRFRGETAFFDVPLHMTFCHASEKYAHFDLRTIFNRSLLQIKPDDAVTFVDNHDTVPGQTLQSWVQDNFKVQAYTLILLRGQGHPCVFYGDLYPNKECYNETVAQGIRRLLEVRKYARGKLCEYPQERNCIGFVREGDHQYPPCAVLLSNAEREIIHTIRMFVGKNQAGAKYRSFMTQHGEVDIDSDGWGEFTCFANAVQVWIKA